LPSEGKKHQDIRYTYDAVGNVLTMKHTGDDVGISEDDYGHVAPDSWGEFHSDKLLRLFEYDPVYRLTAATGRECDTTPDRPWNDEPGCHDMTSVRPYREEYDYDEVGNMTDLNHRYATGNGEESWSRNYRIDGDGNQMTRMRVPQAISGYSYDESGNLIKENTERHHEWDHASNMRAFRNQVDGSKASVFAHYGYDSGGQRVQKVVTKDNGDHHSTVYIDGIFEHHRIHKENDPDEENNTLHVMDDASRIATKKVGPDIFETSKPAIQYHLPDHLVVQRHLAAKNEAIGGG